MNIAIIRSYDFPEGGAAQNRALSICCGLREQRHHVEVHVFGPGKLDRNANKQKYINFQGIDIYNHSWWWVPRKNRKDQILGLVTGFLTMLIALIRLGDKADYYIISNNSNLYLLPLFMISRLYNVRLVRELNEYPDEIIGGNADFKSLAFRFRLKTNYKWFDDILAISEALHEYYSILVRRKTRFLILPMTVDLSRFPQTVTNLGAKRNITYCGDLSQRKDGTQTLVRSFAVIAKDYPDLKLIMIGDNKDKNVVLELKELTKELGIERQVEFPGRVDYHDIPAMLLKSRLLVLSRPNSLQAEGGFPTKLGEYLATGIPVVVTAVGEIPKYLTDGVDAFIAEPDSVESFAAAMQRALNDLELSEKVGSGGRLIAERSFSHSVQGVRLSEFLEEGLR